MQDIFDAGLVLGDTDYRQLSYRDRGQLPGEGVMGVRVSYMWLGQHICSLHTLLSTLTV